MIPPEMKSKENYLFRMPLQVTAVPLQMGIQNVRQSSVPIQV